MPKAQWSRKHRALHRPMCAAVLFAFGVPAVAADCAPEPQGEGRIAGIIDARTLRLDDGRVIRLSGLAPLHGQSAARAEAVLAALATGRTVSLHGDSDAPDRYGRQRVWAFAAGNDKPLQAVLIAAGFGLRDTPIADAACRRDLELAENTAKASREGLWAASGTVKKTESPDDISTEIGHFSVIEGRVRSVRPSGGLTYLNFGRRWSEGFAVTVPKRALPMFETAGFSLNGLEGQRLRVRGYVMRRGGPRIEALGPDQIEVIGGGAGATTGTQD